MIFSADWLFCHFHPCSHPIIFIQPLVHSFVATAPATGTKCSCPSRRDRMSARHDSCVSFLVHLMNSRFPYKHRNLPYPPLVCHSPSAGIIDCYVAVIPPIFYFATNNIFPHHFPHFLSRLCYIRHLEIVEERRSNSGGKCCFWHQSIWNYCSCQCSLASADNLLLRWLFRPLATRKVSLNCASYSH